MPNDGKHHIGYTALRVAALQAVLGTLIQGAIAALSAGEGVDWSVLESTEAALCAARASQRLVEENLDATVAALARARAAMQHEPSAQVFGPAAHGLVH